MARFEQPDRYAEAELEDGRIAIAYVKKRNEYNITYWGNDGKFEQLLLRNRNDIVESNAGDYNGSRVRFIPIDGVPLNIHRIKEDISDLMATLTSD